MWEVGLTHAPIPSPPISFSADIADARSDDLLDIDAAVDAFASLIAARDLEPPLSIGVFGEWGSGKTFFMRRLRRRVGERSSAALDSRVPQREIAFAKRIVQIEFNAWHYSGGNLWAGMVQHIFDNLRLFGEKDPSAVARRQQEILRQMDDLVEIEGQLSEDLRQQEKEHARSLELMRQLDEQHSAEIEKLAELSSLTSDEIKEVLRSDSELDEQVDELQRRVKATGAPESAESLMREAQRSVDLLRRSGPAISSLRERSWSTILALAAALGLSVVLGILVDLTTDLSGVLSTIGAMLTVAVIWLRKANDWYEQRLTRFERIEAILGRKLEDKRRQHEAERRRVAASIAALEGRMDEIGKEMDRVERQRVLLDDQLRRTTPTRVLADFILERAQADDYRQYLGLRARIRDDFEQIAGILDEQRRSIGEASTIEAEEAQGKDRVDRIVLYIDDLDRCEPDVVVDVLQAVHLLLAFPIFVVVVGVDARWISRALHKRYPDLLRHQDTPPVDRATSIPPAPPSEPASPPPLGPGPHDDQDTEDVRATSLDYLEKIFQIPYWLAPMDAVGAERFISGMIGATAPVAGTTVPGRTGAPLASVAAEEAAEPEPTPSAEPAAAPARDPDLSPRALTVDEAERLYMLAVAGLMDSTPRAVKRFLNLYRLVKVMASDPLDFVAVRERYGAPYQVVMVMLAIDAGMPDDTEPMLTAMTETPASTLKEFTSEPRPPEVSELAWERLGEWVSVPGEEDRGELAVSLFRQWIPTVRQFSFRVHA